MEVSQFLDVASGFSSQSHFVVAEVSEGLVENVERFVLLQRVVDAVKHISHKVRQGLDLGYLGLVSIFFSQIDLDVFVIYRILSVSLEIG